MARVTVVRRVTSPGGRTQIVKRIPNLAQVIPQTQTEATAVHLRVMAEEARELIIDRLVAGRPSPGTRVVVDRPRRARPKIKGVERAPFRHAPHSERTIERKADPDKELDGRKLIETGDYINGIEVKKLKSTGAGVYYRVGLKSRQHKGHDGESGKITLLQLAKVHEYGSRRHNIPARPHWGPTVPVIARIMRQHAPNVASDILRRAMRQVRR